MSLHDSVTVTTTAAGKLTFAIFGALAEFERDIIRERTNAGLAAARARGKTGWGKECPMTNRDLSFLYVFSGEGLGDGRS